MKELEIKCENGKICQTCEVVFDLEKTVERYWKTMSFGPWYFWDLETPVLRDVYYHGIRVESYGFKLAIARVGQLHYELVQPLYGIDFYSEFLERKGQGFHHMKIYYDDVLKALEDYKKKGIYPIQSGKFDDDIFIYLDTEKTYGIIWEIGNQGKVRDPKKRYPDKKI